MKTIIQFITLSLLLVSCTSKRGIWEKEVVSLIDGTDSTIKIPMFTELKPSCCLKSNDNGITFRTKIIADIDFGSCFEKSLSPKGVEDETAEERYGRKNKFMKDIELGYNQISRQASQKPHSIVYRVFANEWNRLSKSKATEKILITNSDLMENSDFLNFYDEFDRDSLIAFPEVIKNKFSKQVKLVPLKGATVYFIFQPRDFEQNRLYSALVEIYRQMITEAGGVCKIGLPSP